MDTGSDPVESRVLDWLTQRPVRARAGFAPQVLWKKIENRFTHLFIPGRSRPVSVSVKVMQGLTQDLCNGPGRRHAAALVRGLLRELESRGLCVLPGAALQIRHDSLPPAPATPRACDTYSVIASALVDALESLSHMRPRERLALALLWFITFDLCLDPAALKRLLMTPVKHCIWSVDNRTAIRLPIDSGVRRGVRLIWPNPVTLEMLASFKTVSESWANVLVLKSTASSAPTRECWRVLREVLESRGVPKECLPRSLADYLRMLQRARLWDLGPALTLYIQGAHQSFSAEHLAFTNVAAFAPTPADDPGEASQDADPDVGEPDACPGLDGALAEARSLAVAIHGKRLADAAGYLDAGYLKDFPLARVLAQFALEYWPASSPRHRLAFQDLERLLQGAVCDFADESEVSPFEFCDVYADWIEGGSSLRSRALTSRFLLQFHRTQPGFPPIMPRDIEGFTTGKLSVDARLVSEFQYRSASARLHQAHAAGDAEAHGALMALILLFRLGLRPSELLRLRRFQLELQPLLFVTVRGRVKTPRARRTLPAWELLTRAEQNLIIAWMRSGRIKDPTALVLADLNGEPGTRFIDLVLFELRDITGDPTLRVYQLRHAFASRLFAEAFRSELEAVAGAGLLGPPLPEGSWLATRLHDQSWLPQISYLLGHGSSDITLRHYVHVLDWVVAAIVRDIGIPIPIKALAGLTRLKRSQLYKRLGERIVKGRVDAWAIGPVLPSSR